MSSKELEENAVELKPNKRLRLVIIEPMLFIYLIGSTPMPLMLSQYIFRKVGLNMGVDVDNLTASANNSHGNCDINDNDTNYNIRNNVQAQASLWSMYVNLVNFVPSIISFIVYGSLSDRIGRKFLFIFPPLGALLNNLILFLVLYFDGAIWSLFFMSFSKFLGGADLIQLAGFAYLADTASDKTLAVRMLILQVVIQLSGGVGDFSIGYLIKGSGGYMWPSLFMAFCNILGLIYAILFIPETVENTLNKKQITCKEASTALQLLRADDGTDRLWKLRLIFFSRFIVSVCQTHTATFFFIQNAPLCWNSVLIGYWSCGASIFRGFFTVTAAFVRWNKRIAEEWLAIVGWSSGIAELLYLLSVQNTAMMFLGESGHSQTRLKCIEMDSI